MCKGDDASFPIAEAQDKFELLQQLSCTYNRMEERHSTTSIFLPLSSFWSIHCIGNCLEIELDKQYMAIPVSQQTCVISTWNCFQGEGALICVFMIIDIQSSVTILVIPFVMSSALNAI